jgi:hypothetical protein
LKGFPELFQSFLFLNFLDEQLQSIIKKEWIWFKNWIFLSDQYHCLKGFQKSFQSFLTFLTNNYSPSQHFLPTIVVHHQKRMNLF